MTSIFENTKSKVTVHILHDKTITDENRQKFIRTAEKYSQGLNLVDVSEYAETLSNQVKNAAKHWTIGAMYRLLIPDVLPNADKVIYFDCDVLVNLDISELWNIDLENKSFAAVLDDVHEILNAYSNRNLQLRLIHTSKDLYINSGVLVMNLQKIRSCCNFSKLIFEWMINYAHLLMFPDQDAINSIFAGDIKILEAKFNMYNLEQDVSGCIIHMFRGKPWVKFSGAEHERLYWRHYLSSAWGNDTTPESMMLKLSEIALSSQNKAKASAASNQQSSFSLVKFLRSNIRETRAMIRLLLKHTYHRFVR